MKTFGVRLYKDMSATVFVQAENEDDAVEKANESVRPEDWSETGGGWEPEVWVDHDGNTPPVRVNVSDCVCELCGDVVHNLKRHPTLGALCDTCRNSLVAFGITKTEE